MTNAPRAPMAPFTETRVEIALGDTRRTGGRVVEGWVSPDVPGLAVTRGIATNAGYWVVTHVESGRQVGRASGDRFVRFVQRSAAEDFARALAAVADWTQPDRWFTRLGRTHPVRLAVRAVAEEF